MPKRGHVKVSVFLIFLALVLGLPFIGGFVGDSAIRVRREHGLRLPASASNFECRGDAWLCIMDRGASSAFEIASNDLRGFVAQLKTRQSDSDSLIPGNSQYRLSAPWRSGARLASYLCDSPTGDWLYVEVWPIDAVRVGICLYTDWN
jgi:hypothetical protein